MQRWTWPGCVGLVGMALLLGACHGAGGTSGPDRPDAAPADVLRSGAAPRNHCDADATASMAGATWEPALLARALADAGADEARMLRADSIITKEYQAGRVNVVVDDGGNVVRVYCG